jgi:hypothetical protein
VLRAAVRAAESLAGLWVDVEPELGGDHDVIAHVFEGLAE